MDGPGELDRSPEGLLLGLVALSPPHVPDRAGLTRQCDRLSSVLTQAKQRTPGLDLVVFPELALHGLAMDPKPEILCRIDGPEVARLRDACVRENVWGCFSILEQNPHGHPYDSGLLIDPAGEMRLHYRKTHPFAPIEPWAPGDLGVPVCHGPKGSKLAMIIGHDGLFPELARACADRGATVMLRTAGYTNPGHHTWPMTNQANAFCNLMYTASVCLCSRDGAFHSRGEAMVVDPEGTIITSADPAPDEIVAAEVHPWQATLARRHWGINRTRLSA